MPPRRININMAFDSQKKNFMFRFILSTEHDQIMLENQFKFEKRRMLLHCVNDLIIQMTNNSSISFSKKRKKKKRNTTFKITSFLMLPRRYGLLLLATYRPASRLSLALAGRRMAAPLERKSQAALRAFMYINQP